MEIRFRQYQLSDVDHFMSWACDPEVVRYSQLKNWLHVNSSKEDVLTYFTRVVFPHPWYRAVCLNGEPVDSISLEPLARAGTHNRGRVMVSGALARNYWGRGIAVLAVRKVAAIAFSELPHLNRIEAFVHPKNVGSQRMVEKAGFVKEGVLRNYFTTNNSEGLDFIVYSLLPADLMAARM